MRLERRLPALSSLRGQSPAQETSKHLDQIDAQDAAIARIDKEVDGNVEPFRVALEMLNGIPGVSSLSAEVISRPLTRNLGRRSRRGNERLDKFS
jgi:hypothetical protein